ncbi:MAG: hypothetical protein ACTTJ6_03960 [Treponema sp.]
MKKITRFTLVLMLGGIIFTSFIGCETLLEILSAGSSSYSNSSSSSSETGLKYYFYNYSSYTVTLSDATGKATLSPGGSYTARFNSKQTIYSVSYSPSDKVKVSQSGTSFTFRDR